MLMQKKMGLLVTSVTLILTVMMFAPQLLPVTVMSDETTPSETIIEPAPAPPGMLAYWELNENGGDIVHDSIIPYVNGSTYGGSSWVAGIAGSGLQMLSNQYVDFGVATDLYATANLTIEAWVNLSETSGQHTILMNSYNPTRTMYDFAIEDGHLFFDRQSVLPGIPFISSATIPAGEWHHVAVVLNTGTETVSFYIDGVEEEFDGYHGAFSVPSGRVTIGSDLSTGIHSFLRGMIDEVAIYKTAVTQSVIEEHYQKGLRGLGYLDDFPPNVAPVAVDDSYLMDQDTVLPVDTPGVLGNDIDSDGDSLETDLVSNPTNGGLVLNPDGSFVYTPVSGFVGIDSFEYRAYDGVDYSASATVTITVQAVNHPPVAEDDAYTTDEDTPLSITPPGVLTNDHDADLSDSIVAELVTGPQHGFLTLNSAGDFVYTPDPDWYGTDTFTYHAFDGAIYGNDATVTLTVDPVNDAPVATDDEYYGTEDTELTESTLLLNDYDVDGDSFEIILSSEPSHGVLTLYLDGSFTYLPNTDWFGTDSFTYELYDGHVYSNTATVTLILSGVNDAPSALDGAYSGDEDTTLSAAVPTATDAEGDPLQYILDTSTQHGILTLDQNGDFVYSPDADWFGTDSFTYYVSDGQEYSNTATITITIDSVNDLPSAYDDEFTGTEDTQLSGNLLLNDYDVEWDSHLVYVVDGPSFGVLDINVNSGDFTYLPDQDWFGIDSFTYYVFDGLVFSNVATVTLTIENVNDAPFAPDGTYIGYVNIDLSATVPVAIDPEGDVVTYESVTGPLHGILTFHLDGTFDYNPDTDWFGLDSFTYRAFDGTDYGNIATISIEILEEDDTTGPEITIIYSGDSTDGNPGTWTVSVIDPESGVDSIIVEIDGIMVGTTEGTYAVPNSLGEHTITVTAVNGDLDYGPADQETSISTNSVIIIDDDTTGPEISITYLGDATDGSPGIWTVTIVDAESGIGSIIIEIDGTLVGATSGIYAVPNSLGEHTIMVTATNADLDYGPADEETSVLTSSVIIIDDDTTGPEISITYLGDATDGSPGTWVVTIVDPESGIDWISVEIDSISIGTTSGIYAVPNSLGEHTITVSAGNADLDVGLSDQETSTSSHTVTIVDDDVTAPTISIVYTGEMTNVNPGFWAIAATDLESGIFSILVEVDGILVGTYAGDYAVPSSSGLHSISVTAVNNDVDRPSDQETSTSSSTIEIVEITRPTEIIYTGDSSGVYSDPVYLEAFLQDVTGKLPISGMTIMFTLGTQTAYAVTNEDGFASVAIVLDQQEGIYKITVSFDDNDDYLGSSSTSEFIIHKECAVVIYSGITLVEVSEESLTLRATVFDDADRYWGDLTHIYVTFTFYLSSDPLTPVHSTYLVRVQPTDIAGVGLATLEIPNLPQGDYLVIVSLFPEHNQYYYSSDTESTAITVYEPERAQAHGAGKIKGPDGHKGFFAFSVKYTCKGTLKGFILYTYIDGDWVYVVTSRQITGFDIDGSHAFIEANCTFSGFNFKTFHYTGSDKLYRVRIDVVDNKRSPERDVFQIRIFDSLGQVEYEAGFNPFGYLLNGCIVVKDGRFY